MPIFNAMSTLSIHFTLHYHEHIHTAWKGIFALNRTAAAITQFIHPPPIYLKEKSRECSSKNWIPWKIYEWGKFTADFFCCCRYFLLLNGLIHIEMKVQWKLMNELSTVHIAIRFRCHSSCYVQDHKLCDIWNQIKREECKWKRVKRDQK